MKTILAIKKICYAIDFVLEFLRILKKAKQEIPKE